MNSSIFLPNNNEKIISIQLTLSKAVLNGVARGKRKNKQRQQGHKRSRGSQKGRGGKRRRS
jgi:hypothetical protein